MSAPQVVSPVVTAITDAITGAMTGGLADVQVLDAADPLQEYAMRSVTVGGRWDPDAEVFATDQTILTTVAESGAARRLSETTAVQCIAYAGSGDDEIPTLRGAVAAIMAAIRSSVRAVTDIDGASARVQVADEQWAQGADDKGTLVLVMFTVQAVRLL